MAKPWWEYLFEILASLLTKKRLAEAGAGPDALGGAFTMAVTMPTFSSGNPGAPEGIQESRDMAHCHPELQRRYAAFKADYQAETGRQLYETCTWRSVECQERYFRVGREFRNGEWVVVDRKTVKTNIDGRRKKGRHNQYPAEAVDVAIDIDPGPGKHLSWDRSAYAPFAKLAAKHNLRWGGDWNGNGRTEDERFVDMPHLELPAGVA